MADKGKRMIFEDEYQYLRDLKEEHPDPSAEWGGGGDADVAKEVQDTAAGQIGVVQVVDEEDYANLFLGIKGENEALYKNYVAVGSDGTVALKADESFEFGVQGNKGSFFAAKQNDIEITPDTGYDVNFKVGSGGKVCVTQTGQGAFVKKEVALKEDIPDTSKMVTTDTAQNITGVKTISGTGNVLNVKANSTAETGIQFLNSSNTQIGNLYANRADSDFTNSPLTMALGINSTTSTGSTSGKDRHLGFKYASNNNGTMYYCNAMVPTRYTTSNTIADKCAYIPLAFTDGTNTVKSDETGSVNISTLLPTIPTNYVTTDTNQSITGEKTFESEIKVTDLQGNQTELHEDKLVFHGNGTTNLLPNYNAASYGADVDVTLPATPGTLALTSELPAAVSGTNDGTNWTTLTIGNDTYGVGGGSGSVDIDNQTIIEDSITGKIKTAIGGYKETTTGYTETVTGFVFGGTDFDNTNTAEATALFDKIKYYPTLSMKFYLGDGTNSYEVPITYNNVVISSTKWNNNNQAASSGTGWAIEFYVVSNQKIHIYINNKPSGTSTINTVSKVEITIPSTEIYHKIDTNYLPDNYATLDTDQTFTTNISKTFTNNRNAIILNGAYTPLVLSGSYATISNRQSSADAERGIRFNDSNPPSGGAVGCGGLDLGIRLGAAYNPERNGATSGGIEFYVGTQTVGNHPQYCYYMDDTSLYYVKNTSQTNGANLGTSACLFHNLYMDGSITDGTNTVSVADLAALITYAKGQGWIS